MILGITYSTTTIAVIVYSQHPYQRWGYIALIFYAAWRDWQTHYRQKPYHQCRYYPGQWWQIQHMDYRYTITESVEIPYLSTYCMVLVITYPNNQYRQYVHLWFDMMSRQAFHDCIRSGKGYASTITSGVSIVGLATALGFG